jgi:hypothetical protein
MRNSGNFQERFARNTSGPGTVAADTILFNYGDFGSNLGGKASGCNSARTCADYYKIVRVIHSFLPQCISRLARWKSINYLSNQVAN